MSRTWARSTSKARRSSSSCRGSSRTTSRRLADGEAQYTLLTNERGGIVDDLIAYRIGPFHTLLVVNAGNRDAAYGWLKEREIRGSEVRDASDEYALLAVQGPTAIAALGLPDAPAFTHAMGEVHGIEVMVCRTGYTGEAGVELMCVAEDAVELWDAIVANGTTPCGLGARDTLRLEVCYPLHGNDITTDTDAISAGLGWTCALEFAGTVGSHGSAPVLRESRVGLETAALLRSPVFRGEGVKDGRGRPVLLIPGFLAGDDSLGLMTRWLRRNGYHTSKAGIRANVAAPSGPSIGSRTASRSSSSGRAGGRPSWARAAAAASRGCWPGGAPTWSRASSRWEPRTTRRSPSIRW